MNKNVLKNQLRLAKENLKNLEKVKNLKYFQLNETLTLKFGGKTYLISYTDHRYNSIMNCLADNNFTQIPSIVDSETYFRNQGLSYENGTLYYKGKMFPLELSKKVLEFRDKNIPFKHLIRFWKNLKSNPSYNSRQMLFKFLEINNHPVTEDGCFLAYKSVTKSFKDHHTQKFNNKPGKTVSVARDQVDDNPNNTCSRGLHVAAWNYAKDFGSDRLLVSVKIHPKDVVAVPTDYNGTKMRVCKYKVLEVLTEENKESLVNK